MRDWIQDFLDVLPHGWDVVVVMHEQALTRWIGNEVLTCTGGDPVTRNLTV